MTSPGVSYVCVPDRLWTRYAEMCAATGYVLRPVVQVSTGGVVKAPRYHLDDSVTYCRHAEPDGISERQLQILACFALGDEDIEIGEKLGLALNTIKTHGRVLRAKLHARNRSECVARGYELGLLGGPR